MSAQRKIYLQLAAKATEPTSRIFYGLMADIAPAVSGMMRKNVNQYGPTVIYNVALRIAAAVTIETSANLGGGALDVERLCLDLAESVRISLESIKVCGGAPCDPKMDA